MKLIKVLGVYANYDNQDEKNYSLFFGSIGI